MNSSKPFTTPPPLSGPATKIQICLIPLPFQQTQIPMIPLILHCFQAGAQSTYQFFCINYLIIKSEIIKINTIYIEPPTEAALLHLELAGACK